MSPKNLSTSWLKPVNLISPWNHKKVEQQGVVQFHIKTCRNNTYAFVHDLHGEKFAIATGVAPCADAALVGDAGADGPSEGRHLFIYDTLLLNI